MAANKVYDVETVIDIYLAHGRHKEVGHKYGVTPSTVSLIKLRHSHADATAMFTPEVTNALLITMACAGSVR